VNSSSILYLILLAALISSAAALTPANPLDNKATIWFQKEYNNYFKPNTNDSTPPVIYAVSVSPSALKIGDPRSEIDAFVYDSAGLEMVYADVGNRMNLMLDLDRDHRYTGYCGSNLRPGTYKVTVVAIDKAGNAAKDESGTITIRDPNDLNGNGIEDSLEKQGTKDVKVIVLHDGNLSDSTPAKGEEKFKILPGSALTVSGDSLEKLAKTKGVKGVYKDQKLKVLAAPGENPTALSSSSLVDDPRKNKGPTGKGVTVALIDTGADPDHVALEGKIVAFKDFVNNQTGPYDDNGHGTHCASLIAGDEGTGVAPGAKLVVVKVMDRDGACYLSDALKALDWCLENKDRYGIKVISFSVGGETPSEGSSLLDDACNNMVDKGIVMCVAAGNSGPASKSIVIPGDADKVITVGAIDSKGSIFELSSRGPSADGAIKPDLVTLGVNVVSALAGSKNGESSMSGTSMAVPQVSGASSILLEADPDLKPTDIKRMLLKTADDLGQSGPDYVYGYGAMNLTNALRSVQVDQELLSAPALLGVELNRNNATVGEPVMIEARAEGDIKAVNSNIIGPDRTLEIPMDDFDGNSIYSSRWETSFWIPGDYQVQVKLQGKFGEVDSKAVPFHLREKT
jgi:serine protease AprX